MGHMQPQIAFDDWWKIDTADGTFFVPYDVVGESPGPLDFLDYIDTSRPPGFDGYKVINGYGARMSAPGYLDCTEWVVFDTESEAKEYLKETYDLEGEKI